MDYVACFFAGRFLCNCIPHLACGLRGEILPTPFAKPRGKGPSSQQVQKYERGTNALSPDRLVHAAEVLGVPISYFFDGLAGAPATAAVDESPAIAARDWRLLHRLSRLPGNVRRAIERLVSSALREIDSPDPTGPVVAPAEVAADPEPSPKKRRRKRGAA